MIFLTLNLAYGSFQTAMVKYESKRLEYIASIQGICLLLSVVFLIIYLPFRNLWNKLFQLPTQFVLLMVFEVLFTTSTQLWMGKQRFEYKYKSVVAVTFLTSLFSPVVAYICVKYSEEKGYARILGYSTVLIIVGAVIFIVNFVKGKKVYVKEFWKYAFGFNVPLLAYYLSQVIFNQSDRIMISHITGSSDAAMYGVAYNFAMILSFIITAINGAYVPWMYRKLKDNKGKENETVSISLSVMIGLMIMCIIWYAPEIIYFMAGEGYNEAVYVVAPVALSLYLLFYSQLFINVQFFYEEKKLLVFASIGAALLNIGLNYLLLPIWGFVVAGYTTLASYIVFAFTNCISMRYGLKKRNMQDNIYNYKMLMLLFIAFMACGFLGVFLYSKLIIRIVVTVVVLVLIVIFRNKFLNVLKQIKGK